MGTQARPLAIVTGASAGIGLELAKLCASNGYDLVIAADQIAIQQVAETLRKTGARVDAVQADLATAAGVDAVLDATEGRTVSALLANAGQGLGHAFLDQTFDDIRRVIDTNVTGTLYLVHRVGQQMRTLGRGKLLITGSIAGFMPGSYQAVYNGTKAMIDSFSAAIRNELKETGITVTCLMPGPTDTQFFARADMLDTKVGVDAKQPPEEVAKVGFDAMVRGDGDVIAGWKNKLQATMAHVLPADVLAEQHAKMAAPGTGHKS